MSNSMRDAYERVSRVEAAREATGTGFDVVQLWPELFTGMSERSRDGIRQAVAANWHEGWTPDRAAVTDLAACAKGEISREEMLERALRRATEANQ
ncbi:hypothetical protein GCM10009860_13440 [Microbacterium mitrae]|uniref:Antitoxin VbhA domain-containing protein n=1 Tax=Microbacterium mitrae TaxID=664640 RepID=A0A5C8HRM6_9MICO|nr:hypothetical protein [Microbacterium mitrae]TXK06635.1 hypothetical protein FVP60_06750 [Microbacterium mitrae]